MTEKELVAKAKSACKHDAGTRRAEQESPDVVDLDKHHRSLKAILEDKALKVRWVIEGLLAAGALVIMAGSPKTGKTTLTCWLFFVPVDSFGRWLSHGLLKSFIGARLEKLPHYACRVPDGRARHVACKGHKRRPPWRPRPPAIERLLDVYLRNR